MPHGDPRVRRGALAKLARELRCRSRTVSRLRDKIPEAGGVPGMPSPGPDQGRDLREGLRGEQPPDLLVPDLPTSDPRHGPEASDHPGPVGVDGELAAIVVLELAELPGDQR